MPLQGIWSSSCGARVSVGISLVVGSDLDHISIRRLNGSRSLPGSRIRIILSLKDTVGDCLLGLPSPDNVFFVLVFQAMERRVLEADISTM
jgi:hypothetical protein